MKAIGVVAVVLLAGCYSIEDIRNEPPADEMTVPAGFRDVTACLVDHMQPYSQVVPVIRDREQRATITSWYDNGYARMPLQEIEVVGDGPDRSIVRARFRPSVWGSARGPAVVVREGLAGCGWPA